MKKAKLFVAIVFLVFSLLSPSIKAASEQPASRLDSTGDALTSTMASAIKIASYEPVLAASTYGLGRAVVAGDHNWIASNSHAWCLYYDNLKLLVNICGWFYPYLPPDESDPAGLFPHIVIDCTKMDPTVQYTPDFTYAINALKTAGWYNVEVWSAGTTHDYTGIINDPYYRVLIICWPCKPFSPTEVTQILDFTDDDARGLLFLGDHGTCWSELSQGYYPAAAAPIIGPLGISINNDILYDPTDYETRMWWPKIHVFPGGHPTTTGISIYMPAATATLEVSSPAVAIATGDDDTFATTQSCTGVGGFYVSVDKLTLLAPSVVSTVAVAVVTLFAGYAKKRWWRDGVTQIARADAAGRTTIESRFLARERRENGVVRNSV